MNDVIISAQNLSKRYLAFSSPRARVLHSLFGARTLAGACEVNALHDVSFEIRRGEAIGIIGRNGGGKSTLLQIIAGTLAPTAGQVRVRGRVSAMLELGSGFNPEYSGRDNVILNGLLLGFSRDEILDRFDEVKAFADIGDVIDRPVKTYSSGMLMRLAFAVQVLGKPDILIVDEALSVGDFFFQQKCLGHIRRMREDGLTLLFVSHDMGTVRDLCNRALYLKQGELRHDGDARAAIGHYFAEQPSTVSTPPALFDETTQSEVGAGEDVLRDAVWRAQSAAIASAAATIIAVAIYDEGGSPSTTFKMGTRMKLKVLYRPSSDEPARITINLINKYEQMLSVLSSLDINPPLAQSGGLVVCTFSVLMMIEAGNYSLTVSMGVRTAANRGIAIASTDVLGPISVRWDYETDAAPFLGMVGLPVDVEYCLTGIKAPDAQSEAESPDFNSRDVVASSK